eukprot:8211244-Lingulodinium_polyedra.AAC.1
MQRGFSSVWPAGGNPYFVLPDDRVVQLEVIKDTPYLQPGKRFCRPRPRRGKRCFARGAKGAVANTAPGSQ